MARYFRNLQANFMWDEGAIITNDEHSNEYRAISTVWHHVPLNTEYISARIIEHPDNAAFFQEVWPIGKLEKLLFGTKQQAQAVAGAMYKGSK